MKDFKYTAKFEATGFVSKKPIGSQQSFANYCEAALSDLSPLKTFLPSKEEAEKNKDILYCVFNVAVVNLINKNGDGMDTDTAIQMKETCKHKQININHDRQSGAIGTVMDAYFSSYGDNKPMTDEEARNSDKPFNLVITAAIWRIISDADLIIENADNPLSEGYRQLSTSWEVSFNNYSIARGSRTLSLAQRVKDETGIRSYESFLQCYGGNGLDASGVEVYRVIESPALFLGLGIVQHPAANVKGILTLDVDEDEVEEEEEEENDEEDGFAAELTKEKELRENLISVINEHISDATEKNIKNNEKIISISETSLVTKSNDMKIESLDQAFEALASKQLTEKDIRDYFNQEIEKANKQYLDAKASEAEFKKKVEEAVAAKEEQDQKLKELENEVLALRAEAEEETKQRVFDARFEELSQTYDIQDKKVRSAIAKQIKELDDEGYAFWLENDGVAILSNREKTKVAVDPEAAAKTLQEAVASEQGKIPNSTEVNHKSIRLTADDFFKS